MTPSGSTYSYRQRKGVLPHLPRGLTKRFSKGLRFVDSGGLFYKTKIPVIFTSVCAEERFGLVF